MVIGGGGYEVWENKDKLKEMDQRIGRREEKEKSKDGKKKEND